MPDRIASLYGYIPQRPGASRPDKEGKVEIRIATVKKVRRADSAVDIMVDAPTRKNPTGQHGLLHEGCQVISPGGTAPTGWGVLVLPQVGSQVLAIFLANRTRPFVLGGILWPKADTKTPALLANLTADSDWAIVHPSGSKVFLRATGDVEIQQKAGQQIKIGLTATDKVVMESLLTASYEAIKTWLEMHIHGTPAGPSLPPTILPSPSLTGHGSPTVYGQPT